MKNQSNAVSDRLLDFAASVIGSAKFLETSYAGRHVAGQLIRSSTSAGANYEEARGAESKADFIHKLQLVLKELRESLYWIKLIKKTSLLSKPEAFSEEVFIEAQELTKIIAKSIVTAKKNK